MMIIAIFTTFPFGEGGKETVVPWLRRCREIGGVTTYSRATLPVSQG